MSDQAAKIDQTIRELLAQHGHDRTISPTDVARAIAGADEKQWRLLMKPVRARAILLAGQNDIVILRKGKPVDPKNFKGVYRLALAPQ
jgi:hypothetical protein